MLNRRHVLTAAVAAPFLRPTRAAGGPLTHAAAGGDLAFADRAAALGWLAEGGRLRAGARFVAGGFAYRWQPGARWIPDMADVVPDALPAPEHFGARPDLRWRLLSEGDLDGANTGVYGPLRLGGSNAINGFLLADRYARATGTHSSTSQCRAEGDYLVRSYSRRKTDGRQDSWRFDFHAERPEDIRVAIYRADVFEALREAGDLRGSELAELVHDELPASDYEVRLAPDGMGGAVLHRPEAGQYIDICRQFDLTARWSHSGVLWSDFQTFQIGLNLAATDAAWEGDRIIGRYSYYGSKPANRGQNGVVAGASTGYYTAGPQPRRRNVRLRALLCRAASVRGDENDRYVDSDPSILTAAVGWIDSPVFEVGTFGRTNTPSNMLFLAHWGGRYRPPGRREFLDKTSYPLIETWHPEKVTLEIRSPIDRATHGFVKGWELAAVAGARISRAEHIGVSHPYWIGVGDVSDAYATPAQRGRVNSTPITVGHQTAIDIAPDPGSEYYGVLYKGTGTSKFETYPGTAIAVQRHGTLDVTCEGHSIEAVPGTLEAIRLRQFRGSVDLGECWLSGARKALYALGGDGHWQGRIHAYDGMIHVQHHVHGRLEGPAFGGPVARQAGPPLRDATQGVYAEGQIFATTTRGPVRTGAVTLPIDPLTDPWHDINAGDRLDIAAPDGTLTSVYATGLYVNGAELVGISPLPHDVAPGTVVSIDQSAALAIVRPPGRDGKLRLNTTRAVITLSPP
ncbi:hypothetical protein [Marinovum sp.]|uniref:hypothetical protein n=1 Tax=Marinovum sp. TaxID=2024839 RepID=UPI002B26CCEE|nr:hypothetical protein [Marinovum sp.]